MMIRPLLSAGRVLGSIALLLATACDGGNVIGPANNLEVANSTDTFQWQASALENVSQTLTYVWEITGPVANVNQSSSLTGGSATLRVLDADDTEVYSRPLSQNGTFQTSSGTAGAWTIEVTLDGASGMVNFRLEKP